MEPTAKSIKNGQGVNFNNRNQWQPDDPFAWEKQQNVFIDPSGTFKDASAKDAYEVDLQPHVKVIGMPNPNINHNSSTDCYGG